MTTLGLTLNDLLMVVLLALLAGTIVLVWSISSVRKLRNTYPVTARVAAIYRGLNSDVCFRLEHDPTRYYIGDERCALSLTDLQRTALGQTVTLDACKPSWNPLDSDMFSVPIVRVTLADTVLFSNA